MFRLYILSVVALIAQLPLSRSIPAGAGRAFPVESENYAITSFQKIYPSLEWDHTNFLVDLSGQYANCAQHKGQLTADRRTPDGAEIKVFIDIVQGGQSDINAVDGYIRQVIDGWVNSRTYINQMRDAKRFGCSVRPACAGTAVIACVTTDDRGAPVRPPVKPPQPRPPPIYQPPTTPYMYPTTTYDWNKKDEPVYGQKALAFTPEQYDLAEQVLGRKWDRSHFLEDLSGFETDCAMIDSKDWPFNKISMAERQRNVKISGQYGTAPNKGSTPEALKAILINFKPMSTATEVGCSIIPDCQGTGGMVVVVGCLYEEQQN